MSGARFYNIFMQIKQRCTNKKDDWYNRYWWRWIICEWKSFKDFKRDMYMSYLEHRKVHSRKNTTIERENNNWNYCKDNCKWATQKEQSRNKSSNVFYKRKCIADWVKELWLNYNSVRGKIFRWQPINVALWIIDKD